MAINIPLISVVIPSYNNADFIAEAIDSVINQDYKNIEIIVVNDGSTDNTENVLKPYKNKIRIINQQNEGLASARNKGMGSSNGEFIAWLDADDICHPLRFIVQAAYLLHNHEADIVCSGFSAIDKSGIISQSYGPKYYSFLRQSNALEILFPKQEKLIRDNIPWKNDQLKNVYKVYWGNIWEKIVWGNFIHPPTVMFRANVCKNNEILNAKYRTIVDWEYFIRISKKHMVAYIDDSLHIYRRHENQMTGDGEENSKKITIDMLNVFTETINKNPELRKKYPKKVRKIHAKCLSKVAYAFAKSEKKIALGKLIKSIILNPFELRHVKCLIRLIMPTKLLRT